MNELLEKSTGSLKVTLIELTLERCIDPLPTWLAASVGGAAGVRSITVIE